MGRFVPALCGTRVFLDAYLSVYFSVYFKSHCSNFIYFRKRGQMFNPRVILRFLLLMLPVAVLGQSANFKSVSDATA